MHQIHSLFQRLTALRVALVVLYLGVPLAARAAETWTDHIGQQYTGVVTRQYGPYLVVAQRGLVQLVPIPTLNERSLDRAAIALAGMAAAPRWADASSPVAAALRSRLQVLQEGKLIDFTAGDRPEPDVYLFYFSAHWCGPCRRYTPRLVEAYQEMKADPAIAERFELVFVSSDTDAKSQLRYAQEASMPWPLVKYGQIKRLTAINRLSGRGIPCLVAVTPEGDVLYHSYRGEEYVGPDEPLKAARALLARLDTSNRESRRALHPLAVRQHVARVGTSVQPPQPYVVGTGLNAERFRRNGIESLLVTLEVGSDGCVRDVSTEPALPLAAEEAFRRAALDWQFLPAVEAGTAVTRQVRLPLKF